MPQFEAGVATSQRLGEVYRQDGYITVEGVFTPGEVERFKAAVAQLVERYSATAEPSPLLLVMKDAAGNSQLKGIADVYDHPVLREVTTHPKLLDIVESTLGPNIELHHLQVNFKPQGPSSRFGWHQDYPYAPHTNFDYVGVMVYLDDSTEENGCLQVVPGSHKQGPRETDTRAIDSASALAEGVPDLSTVRSLPVRAGGIELHNCCTLHASGPNMTDRPRTALIVGYRAADAFQISGPKLGGYGVMVRGERPARYRFEGGSWPLQIFEMGDLG